MTLWPAKTSRSSPLVSNQIARKTALSFSYSGHQVEAVGNAVARARARGRMCALTASDDESDDDFPSVEELTRAALRPKISTELQVDQAQFGPDGYLGGSRDQPVILDNDDDLDEAGAESGPMGELNRTRACTPPSQPQNSP